ncbi:hypothetical protein C5B90_13205 [Haloferax sp. Atlit-12N]|nr:hypothetical protein C5B90_13205 [Haloferax sp. Atlit-12N]
MSVEVFQIIIFSVHAPQKNIEIVETIWEVCGDYEVFLILTNHRSSLHIYLKTFYDKIRIFLSAEVFILEIRILF